VKHIDFLSGFCCWKFKQIVKIVFGRKIQLSSQCLHTWANGIRYTNIYEVEMKFFFGFFWLS